VIDLLVARTAEAVHSPAESLAKISHESLNPIGIRCVPHISDNGIHRKVHVGLGNCSSCRRRAPAA
jgi:hypothetical protein